MNIIIKNLTELSALHAAEALQREVWGIADLEVVHALEMIAVREAGGTVIGAFAEDLLIGFVYGFLGYEEGVVTIHSHLAAVQKEWRGQQIGFRLKLAQREQALSKGITRMTWTFDPLQSLNAHFNFARLGVTASKYRVNFYGAETSILVPGIGTDRFWAEWHLDSQRVTDRIGSARNISALTIEAAKALPLVDCVDNGAPRLNDSWLLRDGVEQPDLLITIPPDIGAVQRLNPAQAIAWREITRAAFTKAFSAGYEAIEFIRYERGGAYLLRPRAQTATKRS